MTASPPDSELVESVLAHALELRDQGREDWLEEATEDFPQLRDRIEEAAADTDQMARWLLEGPAGDPDIGRVLGERFRLSQRIGAGAMGVVYLAEDQQLVRPVAVKVLRGGLMAPEHALRRLLREAEAMASVQHPAVITIHDRGRSPAGEPYIVMEWIDGVPLSSLIEEATERAGEKGAPDTAWLQAEHGIDPRGERNFARLAVRWMADIAEGLAKVHAAGVLHRDIKPSNILVDRTGRAVLLDFGLALLDDDSTLTRGFTSVGTPSYMPPESLARGRNRGPGGDVYSLTATLYHLLALRAPYEGTPSEVLAALATQEPKPAGSVRPGLPRDLLAVLEKGMARRPRGRYPEARDLAADLEAFLDFRPVSARPVTRAERLLRRAAHSRPVQAVVVTLVVLGLVWGSLGVRDARATALEQQALAVRSALPPNLTTVMAAYRAYPDEADRVAIAELLDRGVELGVDELVLRQLRASFRIDHGDAAGAAEDMAQVASLLDSAFGNALAERYAELAGGPGADPDLADLPPPTSGAGRYVLATHLLRAGRYDEGDALLARPDVRAIWHGEELRLMGVPFGGLSTAARIERARDAHADVLALESRLGGRTAATAHIGGRFLTIMERYGSALDMLTEGVELSAPSHTLRINAGYAAFMAGAPELATEHLERAIALRPGYTKPVEDLMYVHVQAGDFAGARELLRTTPLGASPEATLWLELQLAHVEVHHALAAARAGDDITASEATASARAHVERARQSGPVADDVQLRILEGLEASDDEAVFLALADFMVSDPIRAWALSNLISSMPADLSPEGTQAALRVLESMQSPEAARPAL